MVTAVVNSLELSNYQPIEQSDLIDGSIEISTRSDFGSDSDSDVETPMHISKKVNVKILIQRVF